MTIKQEDKDWTRRNKGYDWWMPKDWHTAQEQLTSLISQVRQEAEDREREKLKKQVRHWLTKQQAKGQPLGVMEFFPWSIFSSLNQPNEAKE